MEEEQRAAFTRNKYFEEENKGTINLQATDTGKLKIERYR